MMSIKLVALCALLPAIFTIPGISINDMFAYGPNNGDNGNSYHGIEAAAFLDGFETVDVPNNLPSVRWGGKDLGRRAFINFNGHITFGNNHRNQDPATIQNLDASITAIFYPFYSDNDIRRPDGMLYYRLSTQASDLSLANTLIRGRNFVGFTTRYCIIATWHKNKYYIGTGDKADPNRQQENTYQAALCVGDSDSHIIYHYNEMNWDKSEDPDSSDSRIGWLVKGVTDSSLASWVSPYSGQTDAYASQATQSNVGVAGRWMRSTVAVGPCVNLADGLYQVSCQQYRECCGKAEQAVRTCPVGTNFHPTLKRCIDTKNYNCGGAANLCDSFALNGNFADTSTTALDDYIRCKNGIGHKLKCPFGIVFGSSAICN
ncbi:uncharacterized protein [Clytia hemisphaerica]|uniref:Uncharacterized protein n=1 Tax=Clytia hemisphaerica TaxID=252671 RepID=A0A7M5VEG0_9CNID